jgi:hypothetical protein
LYLYNGDTGETVNQAESHPELCRQAAGELEAFRTSCESFKAARGLHTPREIVNLDENDINKLKALGYVE